MARQSIRESVSRKRAVSFRVEREVWEALSSLSGFKSPHDAARQLLLRQLTSLHDQPLEEIVGRLLECQRAIASLRAPVEAILLNIAAVQASLSGQPETHEARVDEVRSWLREHFAGEE